MRFLLFAIFLFKTKTPNQLLSSVFIAAGLYMEWKTKRGCLQSLTGKWTYKRQVAKRDDAEKNKKLDVEIIVVILL